MAKSALYDELKAGLTFADDPLWPTYDPVQKALAIIADVSTVALKAYGKLTGTPEEVAELAAVVEALHDEFIAPIDLPVGPVLETFADSQLGRVLGGLVKPAAKWLQRFSDQLDLAYTAAQKSAEQ